MVDLSEKRHDAQYVHSANASVCNLNKTQIVDMLALMGEALSDRKMNRKIALMAGLMYHKEVGEWFYAPQMTDIVNEHYMRAYTRVSASTTANLLILFEKCGIVESARCPNRTRDEEGKRSPLKRYRRLK